MIYNVLESITVLFIRICHSISLSDKWWIGKAINQTSMRLDDRMKESVYWNQRDAIFIQFIENQRPLRETATLPQQTDIRTQYTKCLCLAPPEDEQVMLETCRGLWFSINWMKITPRWFQYTDMLWCTVSKTLRMKEIGVTLLLFFLWVLDSKSTLFYTSKPCSCFRYLKLIRDQLLWPNNKYKSECCRRYFS
jgi:hypothetical protein